MASGQWCLIESDPGLFSEMLRGFGVNGAQVDELYSLDPEQFEAMQPVHGLIFLFKWRPGDEHHGDAVNDSRQEKIFFAQQVIQNACATQALVNLLLNVNHTDIELGSTLTDFKNFAQCLQPADRGLCLSNSEPIRTVHNSFARPTVFETEDSHKGDKEDNYHFITYLPIDGRLYELDGLLDTPIDHGAIPTDKDWIDVARPVIERRIKKYTEGEIHFNLMAVITDRCLKIQRQIDQARAVGDDDSVQHAQHELQLELERRRMAAAENVRRRHNYVPFILELLRCLADDGKLVPLVQQAQDRVNKKRAAKEQKKREMSS